MKKSALIAVLLVVLTTSMLVCCSTGNPYGVELTNTAKSPYFKLNYTENYEATEKDNLIGGGINLYRKDGYAMILSDAGYRFEDSKLDLIHEGTTSTIRHITKNPYTEITLGGHRNSCRKHV